MFCPNCGGSMEDGALFCSLCGARMDTAGGAPQPKHTGKKINWKLILPILAGIVVIAAAALLLPMFSGGKTAEIREEYLVLCDDEDAVFYTKSLDKVGKDSEDFRVYRRATTDGTVMVLGYPDEDDGSVYAWKRITRDGIEKITDESDDSIAVAVGSGALLYREDVEDGVGTLKLTGSKETQTVAKDAYRYYCISPDGKTILYTANYDADDGSYDLYLKKGSKDAEKLGSDKMPIGVSDGGTYIYYLSVKKGGKTLCVFHRGEEIKITKLEGSMKWVLFNDGMDEIAFEADGKSYVSVKGAEKIKMPGEAINPVCLRRAATCYYGNGTDYSTYLYSMKTLGGRIWNDSESAYFVDKKFDATRVVKQCDAFNQSQDESLIIWLDEGELHIAKANGDGEVTIKEDEVAAFRVSDDGSCVYFLNGDDELFVTDAKGKKTTKIDDDVDEFSIRPGSADCYYIVDYEDHAGTLMKAKKNGEKERVGGGDGAYSFVLNGEDLFIRMNYDKDSSETELYRADGTKLVKVQDGVKSVY